MGFLPTIQSISESVGGQFNNVYTLLNDDNTLMNISGKTFEFSIRTDPFQTSAISPLISVNSTSSTANGAITVNTLTSQVSVVVTSTAMAKLTQAQYYYTLWMDPGLADATPVVAGPLFAQLVSQP